MAKNIILSLREGLKHKQKCQKSANKHQKSIIATQRTIFFSERSPSLGPSFGIRSNRREMKINSQYPKFKRWSLTIIKVALLGILFTMSEPKSVSQGGKKYFSRFSQFLEKDLQFYQSLKLFLGNIKLRLNLQVWFIEKWTTFLRSQRKISKWPRERFVHVPFCKINYFKWKAFEKNLRPILENLSCLLQLSQKFSA